MKLHGYLEQLLGSRASISVLRTLIRYKGKIFTIRRLAQDAGVSHTRVSETVSELERFGVIQIQPIGRSHQISLNEKSYVLRKVIEPMFASEEQTLEHVIMALRKHMDTKKIISAALFGSVSKGKEREDSDIDLLVISNDYEHANTVVSNASEEVFVRFHAKVSPIILSETKLKTKKKTDLVRSILDDGYMMIHGKQLETILK